MHRRAGFCALTSAGRGWHQFQCHREVHGRAWHVKMRRPKGRMVRFWTAIRVALHTLQRLHHRPRCCSGSRVIVRQMRNRTAHERAEARLHGGGNVINVSHKKLERARATRT